MRVLTGAGNWMIEGVQKAGYAKLRMLKERNMPLKNYKSEKSLRIRMPPLKDSPTTQSFWRPKEKILFQAQKFVLRSTKLPTNLSSKINNKVPNRSPKPKVQEKTDLFSPSPIRRAIAKKK